MKKIILYSSILLAGSFSSCVSESPFATDGDGALRMTMTVSGDLTRAESDVEADFAENCRVLISKAQKGLIHKYTGVGSIPDRLVLSTGSYVAEGYAGDSVSASWDKKFYKGRKEFQIQSGSDTQVELVCGIANVVVAINGQNMDPNLIKDWKLTVGHSRAELEFTRDNIDAEGYFMMPSADWNAADGSNLGSLHYTITGKDGNGVEFEAVKGTVDNVKPAHQYTFNVNFGMTDVSVLGGGYISVEIDDTELLREDETIFFGRPVVTAVTEGIDLDEPIVFAPGEYPGEALVLGVKAHSGIGALSVVFPEGFGLDYQSSDLLNMNAVISSDLESKGFTMSEEQVSGSGGDKYVTRYLTLSKAMLDRLPRGEHSLVVCVQDDSGKKTEKVISLMVDDAKVVVNKEPLRVRSYSAQLGIQVLSNDVTNPGVQYRIKGEEGWNKVAANNEVVTLSDLEAASTYEVHAIADGYENPIIVEFTTEGEFQIPNASFEEWSTYQAQTLFGKRTVILPSSTGDKETSFWGSGNEGAATANMTLTDKFADVKHSGNYSVRLESKSALGMIAAGNVFIGKYAETDGTNGVLNLGRELTVKCHPTKLVAWANYRPASGVSVKSGNEKFVPEGFSGGSDHGQIYVALTDEPIEIRTNPDKRKLFDTEDEHVLAYGEITWTDSFGADNTLERIEIPIEYYDRTNSTGKLYLVMVATASKYGDYFSGASGSVIILDDLELVYE